MRMWQMLVDGFRWWMVPILVLIVGGALALVAITGLSSLSAVRYSAL